MRVIGIDLGTTHFAACQMSDNGEKLIIERTEELNMKKEKSHKKRRDMIRKLLADWDRQGKPDIIVMERILLFHKSRISIDTIKRLGSVTYLTIDSFDCQTYDIAAQSWKKLILGSAKAGKQESIDHVEKAFGVVTKNDNLADAICIAEVGLRHFGCDKLRGIE